MDRFRIADNICRVCQEQNIYIDALAEAIGKSPPSKLLPQWAV